MLWDCRESQIAERAMARTPLLLHAQEECRKEHKAPVIWVKPFPNPFCWT